MARILVIEDEADILEIMKMLLEHGPHEVITALDGEEGLMLARQERPDLIILDVMLPKMDGVMVNKELLADSRTCHIPVMVITTQSEKDNALSQAKNVRCYLQKPFDPMILLDSVEKGLQKPRP